MVITLAATYTALLLAVIAGLFLLAISAGVTLAALNTVAVWVGFGLAAWAIGKAVLG